MDTLNAEASSSRLVSSSLHTKKRTHESSSKKEGKKTKMKHLSDSLDGVRVSQNGDHGRSSEKHKRSKEQSSDKQQKHKDKAAAGGTGTAAEDGEVESERKKAKKEKKSSPFEHCLSRMRLSIPPKYAGDWLNGVREVLDGMLMRYVPQMNGVLLAHWEHEFMDDTVKIINESPYGVCDVQFRSVTWAPKPGQRLTGSHSLSSPSHISLLFGKTFNVSIPLQHIPQDQYTFVQTDEDDPLADDSDSEEEQVHGLTNGIVEEVGRWRSTKTGKILGEDGKLVKFTVIGMQVNNQVLSLTGSLLADPTRPPPPPAPVAPLRAVSPSPSPSPEPPTKVARVQRTETQRTDGRQKTNGGAQRKQPTASTDQANEADQVDDRFLSQRELKKKRKEEEKRKRDERKARKEERVLEEVAEAGDEEMVGMSGVLNEENVGSKRKGGETGGEAAERKKTKYRS